MNTMLALKYVYVATVVITLLFIVTVLIVVNGSFGSGTYSYIEKDLKYIKPRRIEQKTKEKSHLQVMKRFHRKISSDNSYNETIDVVPVTFQRNSYPIIQFKKDYPEVIPGHPGNSFQNLSLQMDTTEEDICDANSTFIIAVVPSTANNFLERKFVRESWADKKLLEYTRLRTVFLLGATESVALQEQIEKEAKIYRDILQMNFIDSYRNLTYKTMEALLWISENCKDVPWVLKIDDDVILNPFNLRVALEGELRQNPFNSKIMGRLRPHSRPFKNGKWKITKSEFPGKVYPPFVLGSAYIIGRNAVERLINVAFQTKYFPLEDVFTTGLVAKKARISLKNIEKSYFINSWRTYRYLYKGNAVFYVGQTLKRRKFMWKSILKYKPKLH